MLTHVRRRSLVDDAIDMMRTEVENGTWPVGTRVPTEADLAALLKVSRNTVREAVRVLAYAGILDVRQGDGTYVSNINDPADAIRRIGEAKLRDRLELRLVLDEAVARLAAERRDFEDIARIATTLDALSEQPANLHDMLFDERFRAFHLAIADASHNAALGALYRLLASSIDQAYASGAAHHRRGPLAKTGSKARRSQPDLREHRALFDAVVQQSPDDAANAARRLLAPILAAAD
ncbi:FadR/GntR family transcriptional regulator [Chelatococcus sp. GCM10030263]|uniref:FadR/GntR family transcriptional regulator n=1 Tax=Chelatococcus sp. GCM10030263 TaxID=3273387 RepID=UPI00360C05F1